MKRLKILRRWFKRRFGYARLICLALLIGLAALRISDPAPVEELRVRTFDTFQRIDPRVKTARPVTIVDIDERSLASKLGQWPWPRTRIADLVANLTKLGAVVIAFDVIFSEPDRLNPDVAADTFRNLDEETRSKIARAAEQRSGFGRYDPALARGAGRVRIALRDFEPRQVASGDRAGDARRGAAAVPAQFSGPAAQRPMSWNRRPRAAACSRSAPNATASSGGCR